MNVAVRRDGKLPEITLGFWIIMIIATTLGKTGSDAASMRMGLSYAVSSGIFIGVFIAAVALQMKAKAFHPFLYWAVIVAMTTAGTTMADLATKSVGVGYPGGASLLFVLLIASLGLWHAVEGSISAANINTPSAEGFYWATILFSQTLGTALKGRNLLTGAADS